jgi:DUF2934 family protein
MAPVSRANDYRKHREEARVYAQHLTGAREKAMWLEIAEEWDRMAEKADAFQRGQLGQQLGAAPVQAEGQGSSGSPANDIEDEVRRRAYQLWEQYGRPEGGEEEFWLKAEREIKKEKGLDRTAPEPSKSASGSHGEEKAPRGNPAGSEIGEATGLSTVHVNRSVQKLRSEGLITLNKSHCSD